MINYICDEIQIIFSPTSTMGKVLIFSLFLYLFLFFLEDRISLILRRILGSYYVIIYIIIYIATKNGSTVLGHGTTIPKILSVIPLITLISYYIYYTITGLKQRRTSNQ